MTENDLHYIHQHLKREVESNGGRIVLSISLHNLPQTTPSRKPNIGMAYAAKEQFPNIEFQKSIMVGDSFSDMEFAHRAKMFGIYVGESTDHVSIDSLDELRTLLV